MSGFRYANALIDVAAKMDEIKIITASMPANGFMTARGQHHKMTRGAMEMEVSHIFSTVHVGLTFMIPVVLTI
jgi:hypothetical protein